MGMQIILHSCITYTMFVLQCQGQQISWKHVVNLYNRNMGAATGLSMVPKLKYEHIYLNSFSKMRVDLAAQVCMHNVCSLIITYSNLFASYLLPTDPC